MEARGSSFFLFTNMRKMPKAMLAMVINLRMITLLDMDIAITRLLSRRPKYDPAIIPIVNKVISFYSSS
jgi:hypothetical protein